MGFLKKAVSEKIEPVTLEELNEGPVALSPQALAKVRELQAEGRKPLPCPPADRIS